ncbi:hypothetical protein AAF712_006243 [Marasmius tenuissimus]|uniref:Uncharacterized protein n=1 Tax=Marasmius tenuissimus TaxID=585030 RepID=A0ABR2ZYF7_9AGAR
MKKRKHEQFRYIEVKAEESDSDDLTHRRRSAAEACEENIHRIYDSHVLDDEMGSQAWLDQYLTRLGVEATGEAIGEVADSEAEEIPESQIPEDNLHASVYYGVNLSAETLAKDGAGEYGQRIIREYKEQLETTHQANTKLQVRFNRLEQALRFAEDAVSRKNRDIEELCKMHKKQREDLEARLSSSFNCRRMTMERLNEVERELTAYRYLFAQLGDAFTKEDPVRLSKQLEGWNQL